jgi:hypothetical protein
MAKKVKDDGKMKGSPNLPSRPPVTPPHIKSQLEKATEAKAYAGILKSGMSKK